MKYEDCKNCHFSGVPGTNILGATGTLFCVTTAKGNTKVFNKQEGSDTNLPELTGHISGTRSVGSCWVRHGPQDADSVDVWGFHRGVARVFEGEGNPGA